MTELLVNDATEMLVRAVYGVWVHDPDLERALWRVSDDHVDELVRRRAGEELTAIRDRRVVADAWELRLAAMLNEECLATGVRRAA